MYVSHVSAPQRMHMYERMYVCMLSAKYAKRACSVGRLYMYAMQC